MSAALRLLLVGAERFWPFCPGTCTLCGRPIWKVPSRSASLESAPVRTTRSRSATMWRSSDCRRSSSWGRYCYWSLHRLSSDLPPPGPPNNLFSVPAQATMWARCVQQWSSQPKHWFLQLLFDEESSPGNQVSAEEMPAVCSDFEEGSGSWITTNISFYFGTRLC